MCPHKMPSDSTIQSLLLYQRVLGTPLPEEAR